MRKILVLKSRMLLLKFTRGDLKKKKGFVKKKWTAEHLNEVLNIININNLCCYISLKKRAKTANEAKDFFLFKVNLNIVHNKLIIWHSPRRVTKKEPAFCDKVHKAWSHWNSLRTRGTTANWWHASEHPNN